MSLKDFLVAIERYHIIIEAHEWAEYRYFEDLIRIEEKELC
jgi:hypothetical protein